MSSRHGRGERRASAGSRRSVAPRCCSRSASASGSWRGSALEEPDLVAKHLAGEATELPLPEATAAHRAATLPPSRRRPRRRSARRTGAEPRRRRLRHGRRRRRPRRRPRRWPAARRRPRRHRRRRAEQSRLRRAPAQRREPPRPAAPAAAAAAPARGLRGPGGRVRRPRRPPTSSWPRCARTATRLRGRGRRRRVGALPRARGARTATREQASDEAARLEKRAAPPDLGDRRGQALSAARGRHPGS